MRIFKKALAASLAFVLFAAVFSGIPMAAYFYGQPFGYQDVALRKELSGSLDVLFCGASYGMAGFIPSVFDEETGTHCYNLSHSLLPLHGRKVLIEKELARNPVQTVILEVALDSLERDQSEIDGVWGEAFLLGRLDSFSERIRYIAEYIPFQNLDYCYSLLIDSGVRGARSLLTKTVDERYAYGFLERPGGDITLRENIDGWHNSEILKDPREENLQEIRDIIHLCKENDVEIMLVVVPVADSMLWKQSGEDRVYQTLKDLAAEEDCQLLSFNLYSQRYSLFSDTTSFYNENHMGLEGARVFTTIFADVFNKLRIGQDVSDLFYSSYAEMEQFSPYLAG